MDTLAKLTEEVIQFRDERDWAQFHNAKDLAISLNVEAGELLEQFLWKSPDEANKEKVREELADVFICALLLANKLDLSVPEIVRQKLQANAAKYPVEKSRGNARKYTEL